MKSVMISSLGCLFLTAGLLAAVSGKVMDCSNYDPNNKICTADAIPFCLTNGTLIVGQCHAARAICGEGKTNDPTFAACNYERHEGFDCADYRNEPSRCTKDLIPYCLTNGTVVRGNCNAKQAVCIDNRQLDDDFEACNRAGAPTSDRGGENSAATVSAILFPFLGLLLFALL